MLTLRGQPRALRDTVKLCGLQGMDKTKGRKILVPPPLSTYAYLLSPVQSILASPLAGK